MHIVFCRQPNIGMMSTEENRTLKWRQSVCQEDFLFQVIGKAANSSGFDFYFLGDILIIPDPREIKNNFFEFNLDGISFQTRGEFILFFRIRERKEGIIIADSLTLRQYYFIKNNLRRVDG